MDRVNNPEPQRERALAIQVDDEGQLRDSPSASETIASIKWHAQRDTPIFDRLGMDGKGTTVDCYWDTFFPELVTNANSEELTSLVNESLTSIKKLVSEWSYDVDAICLTQIITCIVFDEEVVNTLSNEMCVELQEAANEIIDIIKDQAILQTGLLSSYVDTGFAKSKLSNFLLAGADLDRAVSDIKHHRAPFSIDDERLFSEK